MLVQTQQSNKAQVAKRGKRTETTTDRQTLIDGLNHDLAGEYQAMSILMHFYYSAKLMGPWRVELRAFFQTVISDEQRHAQFLSYRIGTLGGEPATQPRWLPSADDPREMLDHVLTAKTQAIADYGARIRQAEVFGDLGLKVGLEKLIADETRHQEEIERILADWSEPNLEEWCNESRWQDDGGQG